MADSVSIRNEEEILKSSINAMVEAEKHIKTENIEPAVKLAIYAYQTISNSQDIFVNYNRAIQRLQNLRNMKKRVNAILAENPNFRTKRSKELLNKQVLWSMDGENLQELSSFNNGINDAYIKNREKADEQRLDMYGTILEGMVKEGYAAIMNLRRVLTNQEIIYAIEGQGSASDRMYQAFVSEDDFLEILYINPHAQRENKKDFEKARSLRVDFKKIKEKGRVNSTGVGNTPIVFGSRDHLYNIISSLINDSAPNKLKGKPDAWECYTEARWIFGYRTTQRAAVEDFVAQWVAFHSSNVTIQSAIASSGSGGGTTMSNLAFYRGGDVTSNDEHVMIQNKRSSSSTSEAQVTINSVRNALKYIVEIFNTGKSINVDAVKRLFTATGLSAMPGNAVATAFEIANNYAQSQIDRTVSALNREKIVFKIDI